jgi:hypothetical protein
MKRNGVYDSPIPKDGLSWDQTRDILIYKRNQELESNHPIKRGR